MFELIKNNNRRSNVDAFLNEIFSDMFNNISFCNNTYNSHFSSDETAYYIEIALPGFNKKDIHMSVVGNYIELSCESNEDNTSVWKKSFKKRIQIPSDARENGVSGQLKDGVLSIQLNKNKKLMKAKVIDIK